MLAILTGLSQIWGSIFDNSATYKFNLPIPSLEKLDELRPENRFYKSNPGISAPIKCF
jgi:hypothetical protein